MRVGRPTPRPEDHCSDIVLLITVLVLHVKIATRCDRADGYDNSQHASDISPETPVSGAYADSRSHLCAF